VNQVRQENSFPTSLPVITAPHWSVREAATYLGIAVGTLRNWICSSKYGNDPIPVVRYSSRCLRFPSDELKAWAGRRRTGGGKC